MYTSIDLFAGIGGIRKGFENAFGEDISTVFVSEWDEYAQKTYRANYDDDFEIATAVSFPAVKFALYKLSKVGGNSFSIRYFLAPSDN